MRFTIFKLHWNDRRIDAELGSSFFRKPDFKTETIQKYLLSKNI